MQNDLSMVNAQGFDSLDDTEQEKPEADDVSRLFVRCLLAANPSSSRVRC